MGKYTIISEDAFKELQLNAGVLLTKFDLANREDPRSEDILCATSGGIQTSCVATYSDMAEDVDNCPNNMMEFKKLDTWECKMSFDSVTFTAKTMQLALGAADISSTSGSKNDIIKPRRDLKQSDFRDVWWVGDRTDGGCVAVQLKNALSTGGLSMQTTKDGKGKLSLELTGHVSITDPDVMPMIFYCLEKEE